MYIKAYRHSVFVGYVKSISYKYWTYKLTENIKEARVFNVDEVGVLLNMLQCWDQTCRERLQLKISN